MTAYTADNGVFINKFGILNAEELNIAEYELTERNAQLILTGRAALNTYSFDLLHLSSIHEFLFLDIYEWAGKLRTVPSSKRSSNGTISWFAEPNAILSIWQELAEKCGNFRKAEDKQHQQRVDALVDIFVQANFCHPFPEGNGRSLQIFLKQLAHTQALDLDYTKVKKEEWNYASAVSGKHGRLFEHRIPIYSQPDSAPIRKIFSRISVPLDLSKEASSSNTPPNTNTSNEPKEEKQSSRRPGPLLR